MQNINTDHHYGVVFLSGGGILGAYTGGLQYEDVLHQHRCPAVYLTTSAGFPVAATRAVAEYRIACHEEETGVVMAPADRAAIVRQCHLHLWKTFGELGQSNMMADLVMTGVRSVAVPLYATVAMRSGMMSDYLRKVSPWLTFGSDIVKAQMDTLHPLALALRYTFPDIDAALRHSRAPRIIGNVFDEVTGRMELRDTHKGVTLEQLVGTMAVNNWFPWAQGRFSDGGHSGFNGDYFHVLGDLIDENDTYGDMPVTFVNLGVPDLKHNKANRMVAEQMQGVGRRRKLFREFILNRELPIVAGIDKLRIDPRVIKTLFELGRTDYGAMEKRERTHANPHRARDLYHAIKHLRPRPSAGLQNANSRSLSALQAA